MSSSLSNSSWSELIKDYSDIGDQSFIIVELFKKCKNSSETLDQADKVYQVYMALKDYIYSKRPIQDIEQICKEYQSEQWVKQFLEALPNCTTGSITRELDSEKAHASLKTCFDNAFLKAFGMKMLINSLYSLLQCCRAWNVIKNFHIPSHGNEIKRIKLKLERCAKKCNLLLDLTTFNETQIIELGTVQEMLNEIKEKLESLIDDLKNRIAEAEKRRSNSYVSALMNGLSTLLNLSLWDKVAETTDTYSNSSVTCGASTLIQAGCTLGDLISAGKATQIINSLQDILKIMEGLQEEQEQLSKKVSNKLSIINTRI